MVLKEDFDQAAKDALTLPPSTTNDDKLILYGLFKSATVGKPETSRPGIFDPKGRAKWDAWKKVEDKSKDEAIQDYILKFSQSSQPRSACSKELLSSTVIVQRNLANLPCLFSIHARHGFLPQGHWFNAILRHRATNTCNNEGVKFLGIFGMEVMKIRGLEHHLSYVTGICTA